MEEILTVSLPKKRYAGVVCRLAAEPPRGRPVAPRADVRAIAPYVLPRCKTSGDTEN